MSGYYKVTYPNGETTDGHTAPEYQWGTFRLPPSVTGLKVYDYGTWDGGLAIEAVRRGAGEVWGLDCFVWEMWPETRASFERNVAACAPGVKNAYVETEPVPQRRLNAGSIINPDKRTIPQFAKMNGPADLVVAAGVFYHLKEPLRFLEDLRLLLHPGSRLYMTTWCLVDTKQPIMRFEYGWRGDDTNYWLASPACVIQMAKAVGARSDRQLCRRAGNQGASRDAQYVRSEAWSNSLIGHSPSSLN